MTLKPLSLEDYADFLLHQEGYSFLQTPEMAKLLTKKGMTVRQMAWISDDKVKVAGLLYSLPMTGGLHMEINSGPVIADQAYLTEFYKGIQDFAQKNGALQLIIKPYQTYQTFDGQGQPTSPEKTELISQLTNLGFQFDGLQTGYPGGEPDWHYVKDLSNLTQDNLLASFSKKGKPLVKKTNSFGIKIQALERHELSRFSKITAATSDRREYQDKPLDYYEDFYDSFGDKADFLMASINFQDYHENLLLGQDKLKEKLKQIQADLEKIPNSRKKQNEHREISNQIETFQVRLAEAKDWMVQYGTEDIDLAASLFIYTPQEMVYLFSGSLTEFNKFYAPVALQEYAMRKALDLRIPFYNFLGIQGIFDGSDGVLRFKQNFNGSIVRKMGTFRYYPQPLKFKLIQLIKKILGR